jgi:hypothetical protein
MNWLLHIGKVFFIAGSLFLAGCEGDNICNMTPSVIPQNQSGIYTLTVAIRGMEGSVVQKNIKPYVIVNGERHEMKKHPDGDNMFVFDYHFNGIGTIPYYFEVIYGVTRNGGAREKTAKSNLFSTVVTDKYVLALNANRGPVGASVSIVGSGLARTDKVRFGRHIIRANWLSEGAIEFVVPPVECDNEYEVYLLANQRELLAGRFFVDASVLRCSTDFIRLANGESQRLVFMLDRPAQDGGVEVEITTDIPDSIIMPEVHFMPGERTASVNITGGENAAKGTLFVGAKGYSSLTIPLEIGDVDAVDVSENDSDSKPAQSLPEESDDVVVL